MTVSYRTSPRHALRMYKSGFNENPLYSPISSR
jgi:hypothetical protein